ncbi:MAG: flavin reductase domain protein FMN-binding protein [Mycobacterium sp.]|nr:flavin reductase domain protein FMN-binding protein [Mycobacterium sp.]
MSIDAKHFRRVLGHFPTGVAVITGIDPEGKPAGMAIGSFTSVSLDPPLVAFLPDKSSSSWPKIEPSGKFCVNILASEQESICRAFAVKGGDKFAQFEWNRSPVTGSPRLDDVVAWIDCEIDQVVDAGDHYIVIGKVLELDVLNPTLPLLFFQGGYGRFTALSLAAWEGDLQLQLASADAARPEMEALAEEMEVECVSSAVVNDDMVLIANAGSPGSQDLPTRVGQRIPFLPPLGTAFVAWATEPAREAWLAKAPPDQREALERTLDEVRKAGYSVGRGASWHREVGTVLARSKGPMTPETTGEISRLITALPADYESPAAHAEPGEIRSVSVPVTGPDGTTVLVLTLMVMSKKALAAAVEDHAARLTQAAQAVAAAITD